MTDAVTAAKAVYAAFAAADMGALAAALERMQDLLGACIGCGCLSLKKCGLYNREDKAAQRGAGPRYVMGDRSGEIAERP